MLSAGNEAVMAGPAEATLVPESIRESIFGSISVMAIASLGGIARAARACAVRGAMTLALLLPAAAVVVPLAVPVAAVAQDDLADEEAAPAEEESMLVFYYKALGLRYVVVFLVLSFLLVALLVMCFLQIRQEALMPKAVCDGVRAHVEAKEYQQAYELASSSDSYACRVLTAGLDAALGRSQATRPTTVKELVDSATAAVEEATAEEQTKLEHKVSYVSLIGALAPMFGLLGTVDGMVSAFMVIAKSETQPKPSELAIGISQALITTLIGLWLAIPAIACYALFKNWMQTLNGDIEKDALGLMARFQGSGKKSTTTGA